MDLRASNATKRCASKEAPRPFFFFEKTSLDSTVATRIEVSNGLGLNPQLLTSSQQSLCTLQQQALSANTLLLGPPFEPRRPGGRSKSCSLKREKFSFYRRSVFTGGDAAYAQKVFGFQEGCWNARFEDFLKTAGGAAELRTLRRRSASPSLPLSSLPSSASRWRSFVSRSVSAPPRRVEGDSAKVVKCHRSEDAPFFKRQGSGASRENSSSSCDGAGATLLGKRNLFSAGGLGGAENPAALDAAVRSTPEQTFPLSKSSPFSKELRKGGKDGSNNLRENPLSFKSQDAPSSVLLSEKNKDPVGDEGALPSSGLKNLTDRLQRPPRSSRRSPAAWHLASQGGSLHDRKKRPSTRSQKNWKRSSSLSKLLRQSTASAAAPDDDGNDDDNDDDNDDGGDAAARSVGPFSRRGWKRRRGDGASSCPPSCTAPPMIKVLPNSKTPRRLRTSVEDGGLGERRRLALGENAARKTRTSFSAKEGGALSLGSFSDCLDAQRAGPAETCVAVTSFLRRVEAACLEELLRILLVRETKKKQIRHLQTALRRLEGIATAKEEEIAFLKRSSRPPSKASSLADGDGPCATKTSAFSSPRQVRLRASPAPSECLQRQPAAAPFSGGFSEEPGNSASRRVSPVADDALFRKLHRVLQKQQRSRWKAIHKLRRLTHSLASQATTLDKKILRRAARLARTLTSPVRGPLLCASNDKRRGNPGKKGPPCRAGRFGVCCLFIGDCLSVCECRPCFSWETPSPSVRLPSIRCLPKMHS